MTPCPRCSQSFDPAASGGNCPRCALAAALTTATPAGPADDYEFIAELGRGGMGMVSLVRQSSLDRLVALKVIATGPDPDGRAEIRLLREARAAAAISHPHVVAVHEVGQGASGAFIAMEYCEGGDLRTRLRAGPLAPRAAAELVRKLADAVARAHEAGVLHRDLKPSNVLLTAAGEPKLSDFGLSGSVASVEATGLVAGSPAYLAPEALQPDHRPAPAQDVYGLGAVLYECVTGRAPFLGESAAAVIVQIPQAEPPVPRLLNRAVSRDLETIILKCLEKKPAARYASAADLRDDLDRLLAGHPINARPLSAAGRAWRWSRRHPARATAFAAGLLLLLTLATGSSIHAFRLGREQQRTAAERDRAEASAAETRSALRESLLIQAQRVRESGHHGQRHETLRILQRAAGLAPRDQTLTTEALAALALDDWEWSWKLPQPQLRTLHTIGHDADLSEAAVPDTDNASVLILDLAARKSRRRLEKASDSGLRETRFGPRPDWVLAEYRDGTQAVWGPGDTQPRWRHQPSGLQYCGLDFSPDGSSWWYTDTGNQLVRHHAESGRNELWGGPGETILTLKPSPDGRYLAVVRDDQLEVWNVATGTVAWNKVGDTSGASPAWSPDSKFVVTEQFVGAPEFTVWAAATGEHILSFGGGRSRSVILTMHPDGRRLLTLDADGGVSMWDLSAARRLISGQAGPHSLAVSRDGRRVALAAAYQVLGLAELAPLNLLEPMTLDPGRGTQVWKDANVSPDGCHLVAIKRNQIRSVDLATKREGPMLRFASGSTTRTIFQRDGLLLYSSYAVGIRSARLTQTTAGLAWTDEAEIQPPSGHRLLDINGPDNWWLTERADHDGVFLWPGGNSPRPQATGPLARDLGGRISGDGRWLVLTGTALAEASVYSLPTGTLHARLPVSGPSLGRFSPDGRWLVLGSAQGYDIWNTGDLTRQVHRLDYPQPGAIYGYCTFSPDGARFVYNIGLSTMAVARPGSWRPTHIFTLPHGVQRDAWAWAPDGSKLYLLCGRNEAYALDFAAADRALKEQGLDWRD